MVLKQKIYFKTCWVLFFSLDLESKEMIGGSSGLKKIIFDLAS